MIPRCAYKTWAFQDAYFWFFSFELGAKDGPYQGGFGVEKSLRDECALFSNRIHTTVGQLSVIKLRLAPEIYTMEPTFSSTWLACLMRIAGRCPYHEAPFNRVLSTSTPPPKN